MTNILLFAIAVILLLGFWGVLSVLCEIREHLADSCEYVKRVADEIAEEEEDEWMVVRGNPPFGSGYGSGKTRPPTTRREP